MIGHIAKFRNRPPSRPNRVFPQKLTFSPPLHQQHLYPPIHPLTKPTHSLTITTTVNMSFALRPRALRAITTPIVRAARFSTTSPRALAKMSLIGRLADAPEAQDTATGRQIIRYALGVSTGPKDDEGNRGVSWFRIAAFANDGPQKDLLLSLQKGTLLHVEADAKMDSYEAQDGSKRTALNLVQRRFLLDVEGECETLADFGVIGSFETLSRPQNRGDDAVESPQSGLGAS